MRAELWGTGLAIVTAGVVWWWRCRHTRQAQREVAKHYAEMIQPSAQEVTSRTFTRPDPEPLAAPLPLEDEDALTPVRVAVPEELKNASSGDFLTSTPLPKAPRDEK